MKRSQDPGSQGFNLIDLSVSFLLGTIVISVGGTALSSILTANRSSVTKQEAQTEATQALEFIVSEARQAQAFIADAASLNALKNPGSFQNSVSALPGVKEPVVVLNIGASDYVVYFLAPSIEPWQGKALYRWGPPFDQSGNYEADSSAPGRIVRSTDPTYSWKPELLVDQVSQRTPALNCNGWDNVPRVNVEGFYSCVDSDARIAELVFRSDAIENMELRAKVFTRSHSP